MNSITKSEPLQWILPTTLLFEELNDLNQTETEVFETSKDCRNQFYVKNARNLKRSEDEQVHYLW